MPRRDKKIQKVSQETKLILRVSSERELAEVQLHRLKEKSLREELSLEDIKKYDLLVKNLLLLGGSTDTPGEFEKLKDVSDADLVNAVEKQLPTSLPVQSKDSDKEED